MLRLSDGLVEVTIRVFIVTPIRLYQDGLASALAGTPGIEVVGSASGCDEALARVRELAPDVVLVDTAGTEGVATVRALAGVGSAVIVLAVPEHEDEILRWAEAGVAGYVTRDGSLDDLLAMVGSVARGETLCSPRVAASLFRRVAALAAEQGAQPLSRLTSRELQIVGLIGEGLSNKEIARQLHIELATVKNHVHNILEKLQVKRRGEVAARLRGDVWMLAS